MVWYIHIFFYDEKRNSHEAMHALSGCWLLTTMVPCGFHKRLE